MPDAHADIQAAKRALGRALRSREGFVGVGLGPTGIRLYAQSEQAPVVEHFRSRYGDTYRGFDVAIVPSPGFRASASDSQP